MQKGSKTHKESGATAHEGAAWIQTQHLKTPFLFLSLSPDGLVCITRLVLAEVQAHLEASGHS